MFSSPSRPILYFLLFLTKSRLRPIFCPATFRMIQMFYTAALQTFSISPCRVLCRNKSFSLSSAWKREKKVGAFRGYILNQAKDTGWWFLGRPQVEEKFMRVFKLFPPIGFNFQIQLVLISFRSVIGNEFLLTQGSKYKRTFFLYRYIESLSRLFIQ